MEGGEKRLGCPRTFAFRRLNLLYKKSLACARDFERHTCLKLFGVAGEFEPKRS